MDLTNGHQNGGHENGGGIKLEPDWRDIASATFVKRAQKPGDARGDKDRFAKKFGPVLPVRLAKLPDRKSQELKLSQELDGSQAPSSLKKRKPRSNKSQTSEKLEKLEPPSKRGKVVLVYNLPKADPTKLYRQEMTDLEILPLELFDCEEFDRPPQDWIQLGIDKYAGQGTAARSPFFQNREWTWSPCRVLSYKEKTQTYKIIFSKNDKEKEVKRLGVLFDDENELKFRNRIEACKALKEECLAIRRYTAFVENQPDEIYAPIHQSALHGIVTKLMKNCHDLVISRQDFVEGLLIDARDNYNFAMKQAIVEFARLDPEEEAKMIHLKLPPLPVRENPPNLGVIELPRKKYPVKKLVSLMQMLHFSVNPESTQVILAMFKSWTMVKRKKFFETDQDNLGLPITLYDYDDFQEGHYHQQSTNLHNNWRFLVTAIIRDNLANVFQLFINSPEEYEKSGLKRFLKMIGFMLRTQLVDLIDESLDVILKHFQRYANPQGSLSQLNSAEHLHRHGILAGYLEDRATPLHTLDPGRSFDPSFLRPLFVFELGIADNEVVFIPPLDAVVGVTNKLTNLPKKLADMKDIDPEIVPLLRMNEKPILSRTEMPKIYNKTDFVQREIATIVTDCLQQPQALAKLYHAYGERLCPIDVEQYAKQWFPTKAELLAKWTEQGLHPQDAPTDLHTQQETEREIQKFVNYADEVSKLSPTVVTFRMIRVNCEPAKRALMAKATTMSERLMQGLCEQIREHNLEKREKFGLLLKRVRKKSQTVADLAELKQLVNAIETTEIPKLQSDLTHMRRNLSALDKFGYEISREDFNLAWSVTSYPVLILRSLDDTKVQMDADNVKFQKELQEEQSVFLTDLEEFAKEVATFREFGTGSAEKMDDHTGKVDSLREKLEKADQMVQSFQERDVLFSGQVMDYTEHMANDLTHLKATFRPYLQLWSTASLFITSYAWWMRHPFKELDAAQISENVNTWHKLMYKLEKEFSGDNALQPSRVAAEMKDKMAEFKEHVPVIQWLLSPGLRERHWAQLSEALLPPGRLPLVPDEDLNLRQILNLDISKHKSAIEEIVVAATKEYQLEQTLEKMLKEWKSVKLDLEPYKLSKTYILKRSDEILILLDDQIMKTQGMRGSPYIKFHKEDIKKWEKRLHLISQIMEEWLKCQKTWMYLDPIFSSDDIMRQMPIEGRRFKTVDTYWRKTMEAAFRNSYVLEFVSETDNLLKTFQESNKMLDVIGRGLNDYLEQKRLGFPRFYFLSNDELLSIISQTKNATAVQPHLNKCFDAVHKLHFEEDQTITGMYSAEGEFVKFATEVDPNLGVSRGNVEIWLKEVEFTIFACMQQLHRYAIGSYPASENRHDEYDVPRPTEEEPTIPREEWLLKQPGQVALSITQLFFTRAVTFALEDNGNKGLVQYLATCVQQLERLVKLVRGELTSLQRKTCSALTVIDVHARDVLEKMVQKGVDSPNDFEWLAQLRYYWQGDGNNKKRKGLGQKGLDEIPDETDKDGFRVPDGVLGVHIVNSYQAYGYEYLGNSSRLVITPLTDRCYRTLMGAIHLHLGGAPEGPAGTGKTETVKDLAKAVAIQCLVFNCSDGLTYLHMQKMFKGLAASGAWACMDEFNRIELEVLSVVAQQIGSIQRTIMEGRQSMQFDGVTIAVKTTCSVFITMNPGYAGRAELPNNLKTLFRTVAMMIPDYALIAEIILYSFGYLSAKELAQKTVNGLHLASEQLSSQDHYDFGMRTLNSVLDAAGTLKRKSPEANEAALCVQALKDCNIPKFVSTDVPLFNSIVQDLFPGVEAPNNSSPVLEEAILKAGLELKYQPVPTFLRKINELLATFEVRHGLMVVGDSYSGKSATLKVLSKAVTSLAGQEGYGEVHVYHLNPKSVQLRALYGADDPATQEWKDGILAVLMRACIDQPNQDWKWIIFDGPVDAIWIENMNTVLDNNKKLCLASGESLRLVNRHTMVFEIDDLSQASPATVSRCGMVYMEQRRLGWQPVFSSWLASFPEQLTEYLGYIQDLADWIFQPTFDFIQQIKPVIQVSDVGMVVSMMRIFRVLIDDVLYKIEGGFQKNWDEHLEPLFVFAVVWSFGCGTGAEGRKEFSDFIHDLTTGNISSGSVAEEEESNRKARQVDIPFPHGEGASVYDYIFNIHQNMWQPWMETMPLFKVADDADLSAVTVPTIDTIRTEWLLGRLILNQSHVLLTGETGTGKSVVVKQKLAQLSHHGGKIIPLSVSFSARTTAKQAQDAIDDKLDRRRYGVFGPPTETRMIIFIDDLNMPTKERYGAQPPIELFRQWMDYDGWYDLTDNSFRQIVDVQFLGAMGPPGGGRNQVTYRFLRHFHSICLVPYNDDSLKMIFGTILDVWVKRCPAKVAPTIGAIVEGTIAVYNRVMSQLLPTPSKSHYTYNLRDVNKVIQGIVSAYAPALTEVPDVIRLWYHEASRVFSDRLATLQDLEVFLTIASETCQKAFTVPLEDIVGKDDRGVLNQLVFADFTDGGIKKDYVQVANIQAFSEVVDSYLAEYNKQKQNKMDLVLFGAAVEHVSRISRILRSPSANALLVGVGGSGRQSLAHLAAFIADYEVYQLQLSSSFSINDWHDSLRELMRMCGVGNRSVVFLLTDTHIKDEAFVEDINHILNIGQVPNLFPPEEKAPLVEQCLEAAVKAKKASSDEQIFEFFIERCKKNLHLVLCFSPIGESFRNRLLMFPSIVACTTIDWFHPWPTEALNSVAFRTLQHIVIDDDIKKGVVDICVDMQERVFQLNQQYFHELRRHNYVTPTSYLELLKLFQNLLDAKRSQIKSKEEKYLNGLEKLNQTEVQVKAMKVNLEKLQPRLKVAQAETDALMVVVGKESAQAQIKQEQVAHEEALCMEQAAVASAIAAECTEALAAAMPALNSAMKALRVVKKHQLDELKAMKVPTAGVLLTVEALCILMGVNPRKVGQAGKKTLDYWDPAKKVLFSDTKFLAKLENYDKDNIRPDIIEKVRPFIQNPDFSPSKIANASKAAEGFCKWVIAMEMYDRRAQQVAPKQLALKVAQEKQEIASQLLEGKKAELFEAEKSLQELNEKLQDATTQKVDLQNRVNKCSIQLDRAEKLIDGLSGEKVRWLSNAQTLAENYKSVVGDTLLSSGVVAYLGVFTNRYREQCLSRWIDLLQTKGIQCSQNFKVNEVLGNEVTIREWGIQMLPNDEFSITNAIILTKAQRWGLIIDPQEQANRWIRNMEDEKNQSLKVVKHTDDNFIRTISSAVQVGLPVLIEDVRETIDPTLEPILGKQTFKVGSKNMIKVAGETYEFNDEFRLYLTTKLENPHYGPEICVKVTLLCFMVTPDGLEDQLLGKVVSLEEPATEQKRVEIIVKNAENKKGLQQIEKKILEQLNMSKGAVLDDEELIETLQKSKKASQLLEAKLAAAAKHKHIIDQTRMEYKGVAESVSNLFFCISDLANVDPMYQYSLAWFITLFTKAIKEAPPSADVHVRTHNIEKTFLYSLYLNVCRSLFEKDKLFFSFLLCIRYLRKEIDPAELRFLLTGTAAPGITIPENPCRNFRFEDNEKGDVGSTASMTWLSGTCWEQLVRLSHLPAFNGFHEYFDSHQRQWRAYYEHVDPYAKPLPGQWDKQLSTFQKMLVLRCLRPDKIVVAVTALVAEKLGKEFIQPPPFDLGACFAESNMRCPLIFILSPGVDPSAMVYSLAMQWGYNTDGRLAVISLGQGQGSRAETAIREAVEKGTWVMLQNCHLLTRWLPTLQKVVEDINPQTGNSDFRLFLTSTPSPHFPISILQNGVKMTNEPPKGLKANLTETYRVMEDTWFEDSKRPEHLKKLMFGLAFFHAVVLERRKFGAVGWNIPYEWTVGDLSISQTQTKMFLDSYTTIPIDALWYCLGELNYGGRVTDEWDNRTLSCILTDFVNLAILEDQYKFDANCQYGTPPLGADLDDYRKYIKTLPAEDSPMVFGLHENVNISSSLDDTSSLFATLLLVQPRDIGVAGFSREHVIGQLAQDLEPKIPKRFDIDDAESLHPVSYENSMNTILVQELIRFNRLIDTVRKSLLDVQRAIKGEVVMSWELEKVANSMYDGQVPEFWAKVAYPSVKPLSAWVQDLIMRVDMFREWVVRGNPAVYWISGFFFTQSFLTGTLQNYARKHTVAIDQLAFEFDVMMDVSPSHSIPAPDGCYVYGLFLEGARFDTSIGYLVESFKQQLHSAVPTLWFKPVKKDILILMREGQVVYNCPVYKTSKRFGLLSTTGRSTNYILTVSLPSQEDEKHWVKRGVAMLTQLDT